MPPERHPAYRVLGDPDTATGPFVFTCEHASNRAPDVHVSDADRRLLDDHWGYDIGAADVVDGLVRRTDGVAVLSDFTRLLIDPNRPLDAPTLVRRDCDGQPVEFNQDLTPLVVEARRDGLYAPYHAAIDHVARRRLARDPVHLLSIHTFSPTWDGAPREMEMGVLCDAHEAHAERLAQALEAEGFIVALNAPYSGRDGFMFAVDQLGRALDLPCLELEIRQDLVETPAAAALVARRLSRALPAFAP